MVGHQIEDLPSDPEDVFDEYDEMTRKGTQPERGPLQDYIVSYFQVFFIGPLKFYEYFLGCITHCWYYYGQQVGRFANESLDALSVPIGDPEEASRLRAFVQVRPLQYGTEIKLNFISSQIGIKVYILSWFRDFTVDAERLLSS
ncbi:hypothetical protein HU200_056490 [Digitaria exilis]|uniref:Uncharacterized protein n=1 Tax=Digitaria exilis TaxID=1010633 RepID=A0A835E0Y3_9POAL|nr:hypothetical protein HU200_056490 [Digitaria exilis]